MKKLMLLSLFLVLQSEAQLHSVELRPVQAGLLADCQDYADYLVKAAASLTADDIEYARLLPLKGQMKNSFAADLEFKIPEHKNYDNIIAIDFSSLKEISVKNEGGTLTALSRRFGLKVPEPYLSTDGRLQITSRDLLCDLLLKKVTITAKAPMQIILSKSATAALEKLNSEIAAVSGDILAENSGEPVKAALLGVAYAGILSKNFKLKSEIKAGIQSLFERLFKPGSLELSEAWEKAGGRAFLILQNTKALGFVSLELRMESL